jgi:hypothetical protein
VRDIDGDCSTRATALRSFFFVPPKSSNAHPSFKKRCSTQNGTEHVGLCHK